MYLSLFPTFRVFSDVFVKKKLAAASEDASADAAADINIS